MGSRCDAAGRSRFVQCGIRFQHSAKLAPGNRPANPHGRTVMNRVLSPSNLRKLRGGFYGNPLTPALPFEEIT
jgi:hypothetical protein